MKKWIRELSNSGERQAMPIMTYPGLKLIQKNVLDVIRNGENQFECIKALADRYPSIAAVTIMDLSVEAEAFGSPVKYSTEDVPTVVSRIIEEEAAAVALRIPRMGEGRTSVYLKAAELAASSIEDRPVFGGEIGPFSLAGRLFDMTEIMITLFDEPETVHLVLEKATAFLAEYAKAFKNAGANGIIIAEPAAGLLSPQQCAEFSSQYVKRIVDAVQDDHFIVILHNCGNTKNLVPSMLSTGAMAFHFGNAVDMTDILPQIPWGRLAFGNIDPAGTFKNGTVEEMREKVRNLLAKTAAYKNYVLSSGCDVPPGTPAENIDAFFSELKQFNEKEFYQNTVA
jgi:uroporphyrinogen decarboxylase